MQTRKLYVVAGALVLVLIAAVAWLLLAGGSDAPRVRFARPVTASNPVLDLRVTYDSEVFTLVPFDAGADYPLQLDADSWSFYGKRIGGMGAILKPGPGIYDYLTSMHDSTFREWYGLTRAEDPVYEDVKLAGQPALHTVTHYEKPAEARGWPNYFPAAVKAGDSAWVEGWVLMTPQDLYFFYAISPDRLNEVQRNLCISTINRMQFGVLGGGPDSAQEPEPPAETEQPPAPATP